MGGETILVTDAGQPCSVAVIRSLGRAGHRVVAADSRPRCAGMVSRFADTSLVYPPPELDPAGYVQCLYEAVAGGEIAAIFPMTDQAIVPLLPCRDRFAPRCVLAMADPAAWETAADKERTQHDARRLGIPVPRSSLVRTVEEALSASKAFPWPLVVKPRLSTLAEDGHVDRLVVAYASNQDELRRHVARLEGRCDVLLQEYVQGRGVGVELLLRDGEPILSFQHERLREFPVHGGPGSLRRSDGLNPVLRDYAVSLLASWRWTGLAMVEFKCSGDQVWLIEVNGRAWGSMALAVMSGVDFPARYIRMLLDGEAPSPAGNGAYRSGLRARDLDKEIMWIIATLSGQPRRRYPMLPSPTRREALLAALQLLHPAIRCDVQTWRDPLPGLVDLGHTVRRLGRKVRTAAARGRRPGSGRPP